MKKIVFAAAAAAAFALPGAGFAQQTGTINVNATVADYIQFGPAGTMAFGNIQPGSCTGMMKMTRA